MGQSNPLTAEIKAAFADALIDAPGYPRLHRIPTIYSGSAGLGSRDVRPGDFIAVVKNMVEGGPALLRAGHQPRTGARQQFRSRCAPAQCLFDARAFGRRLRFGHDQQGHRHHRRRSLRSLRAGLSQVWLGEEGPAHDLLSHRSGRADPHPQRIEIRRIRAPERRQRLQPGQPAASACRRAARSSCSRVTNDPKDVWENIPEYARRIIRRRNIRVLYLDAAAIAREVASEPDLQVRMQGIVLAGRLPQGHAFPASAPAQRGRIDGGRGKEPAQVLRQARRAGGAGQPHGSAPRLQPRCWKCPAPSSMWTKRWRSIPAASGSATSCIMASSPASPTRPCPRWREPWPSAISAPWWW